MFWDELQRYRAAGELVASRIGLSEAPNDLEAGYASSFEWKNAEMRSRASRAEGSW
jgi:hypothetical protein